LKKQSDFSRLMGYAGRYRVFTYASWVLSAISALTALVPFLYIWMILRDVLAAAPDYAQAVNIPHYGWMAVLFAVLSYLIYIAALMCSHLSAFRVATNLRLAVSEHTISFVFQNSRLLKGSILDNVRLGRPQATEAEVLAALKAAQCMDIVEKFPAGIHTVIGTKGVYLSGGEQQRIAIARAMLKNAPILILDEATAFADPDNEAKVQAAFARLAKGKTVLMIAHRLSTVANADCIYVVQDGQIAESGTKDELCAQNGLFARMWQEYQASVQWKVAKEG
jgi:ABC-type transport system involved in cytochrome bd biosynthesis fused ATPase/permease subunit